MKKIYLLLVISFICSFGAIAQTVTIFNGTIGTGTSGNVVIGASNYHVDESIYTEAEIGASNFITAGTAINSISYYASAIGGPTPVTSFKIWMKNVPAATTTFTAGNYSTTGYTLVYDGTFSPSIVGANPINLTTPFTRTAGSNLQILIERNDNSLYAGFVFNTANNQTATPTPTVASTRRYNGATLSAALTTSAYRPAIDLAHLYAVDAGLTGIENPTISCYSVFQNIGIVVTNSGTSNIAPGAASVNLKISGANTFNGTLTNTAEILPGASETISFSNINLNNAGINYDTAKVTLANDENPSNDTLKATTNTSEILSAFPLVEDAEATPLTVFPYAKIINLDQSWLRNTGNYGNASHPATDSLIPRAPGTKYYLFDSWNAIDGTESRLYSKCVQLVSGYPAKVSFWMSHDSAFSSGANLFADSLYVSISTDKGLTWTRLGGFQRPDASLTLYAWKKDSIDLTAYAGQLVQLGFEGVSKYGNAFGLDDINVFSGCENPVTPSFNQVDPICAGASFTLPNTSNNSINGTWYPPIDNLNTTTYTFTPGLGVCAVPVTMTVTVFPVSNTATTQTACGSYPWNGNTYTNSGTYIHQNGNCSADTLHLTVNPNITPIFDQVPSICAGGSFTLPTTSNNGIDGLWIPVINTAATTPYTFTPTNTAACYTTATMTVVVNQIQTPTFTQVDPICEGGSFTLATASNENITGQWTPTIDNMNTTTYTFTPDAGQCAAITTMTVTVNPILTSTFTSLAPVCSGSSFSLPTTSLEGVQGNWTPDVNNTNTTTYTFVPDNGQCGTGATMTVEILPTSSSTVTIDTTGSFTWNGTTYTSTGTYTWVGQNYLNCDSTVTLNLTIRSVASAFISPNPNKGSFDINYSDKVRGISTKFKVLIFDAKGSRVYNNVFVSDGITLNAHLDISKLPAGIYYLDLIDASEVRVKSEKIVKY